MMLKIVASINDNEKVNVPLLPIVLALAFSGGLGGCLLIECLIYYQTRGARSRI